MKISQLFIVGLLLSVCVFSANAQVTQQIGSGSVNWGNQVIRATGIGAPNPNMPLQAARAGALTAAKSVALRNLLEIVKGISLTSETTVENAMVSRDIIITRVEGVLRNFYLVGEPRYMSTGDVEVTVEMPLTGDLSDVLLTGNFGSGGYGVTTGQAVCPTCGQPWPANRQAPPGMALPTGTGAGGAFTGLIVDTKGLGLRPAMAPKIVDESGNEIYGSRYVSRDWAVKIGMVGYEKDTNRARTNDRVTNNPLVIRGLKASGPNMADIVVSNADAAAIRNAAASMNFLDKCKVMFIVD
jgi:hypothetical protein